MTITPLGCGDYRVLIQERGGERFVTELLDLTSLEYSRILNDISEATVEVTNRCCGALANVNPWQHEVAIFRNEVQVWVGPIIDMEFAPSDDRITIAAKDLFSWTDHRLVELANTDYDPDSTDLADAFIWLFEHAYCKDPWGMTYAVDPTGIPIPRYYPAFDKAAGERWGGQYVKCGEEMRTLAESGIDYTIVNRHLWGGSLEVINPVGSGIILTDRHFRTPPVIRVAGSNMMNRTVSAGGSGGVTGYYNEQMAIYPPTVGPITPSLLDDWQRQFGLLETLRTTDITDDVDTTVDPNPVAQDAKTQWELLHVPYTYVDEGVLDNSAPLDFNTDLIPGATFKILLENSCRKLTDGNGRLNEVNVSVSGKSEEVSITLTPLGTTSVQA